MYLIVDLSYILNVFLVKKGWLKSKTCFNTLLCILFFDPRKPPPSAEHT